MNKAFIFDMDGVIIASEKPWHDYLDEIWPDLIGTDVASIFQVPVGMTPLGIYEGAVNHGSTVSKEVFLHKFNEIALKIYEESPITEDTDKLGQYLLKNDFKIGIVSSSRMPWIETVLKRLSFGHDINYVISINDRTDLKPKPDTSSYKEAIKYLEADFAVILEDSNSGILAAKGAGAFTIGLTSNLLPGYQQKGTEIYAHGMNDVIRILEDLKQSNFQH